MSAQATATLAPVAQISYFGWSHHLAEVASRHCQTHPGPRLGGVACGACWEMAIRDDERIAVECDLPREITPDPTYVDEIAIRLASEGERVPLTRVERAEAIERLYRRRYTRAQIADRLHMAYRDVPARTQPVRRLAAAA